MRHPSLTGRVQQQQQHRSFLPCARSMGLGFRVLRKAYKQLPLSADALSIFRMLERQKSFVPWSCRLEQDALWYLGLVIFLLYWTLYFDDFVLTSESDERRHLGFVGVDPCPFLGSTTNEAEFSPTFA